MTRIAALAVLVALSQSPLPIATRQDQQTAQLAVAEDGKRVTIRRPAKDTLELCVEPTDFGRVTCFTVGEIRRGEIGRKPHARSGL